MNTPTEHIPNERKKRAAPPLIGTYGKDRQSAPTGGPVSPGGPEHLLGKTHSPNAEVQEVVNGTAPAVRFATSHQIAIPAAPVSASIVIPAAPAPISNTPPSSSKPASVPPPPSSKPASVPPPPSSKPASVPPPPSSRPASVPPLPLSTSLAPNRSFLAQYTEDTNAATTADRQTPPSPISISPSLTKTNIDVHAKTMVPPAPTTSFPGPFGINGAEDRNFSTEFLGLQAEDTPKKVDKIAQDYYDRVFVETLGANGGTHETGLTSTIKSRMLVDGKLSLEPVMEHKKLVDKKLHTKVMELGKTTSTEFVPNWEAAIHIIEGLAKGKVTYLDSYGNVLKYNDTGKKVSPREMQLQTYYALRAQNLSFEQISDLIMNNSTIEDKEKLIARFSEIAFGASKRAPEVRSGSAISQAQFEGKNEEQLAAYKEAQRLEALNTQKSSSKIHFPFGTLKPGETEDDLDQTQPTPFGTLKPREFEGDLAQTQPNWKEKLKQKTGAIGWLAKKLF